MKRFIIAFAGIAVVAAAAYAVLRPTGQKREIITIAQTADFFLYAPIYVAKDAGLFDKEGLDVRIVSTGGDDKSWAAVIGGSAQFGVGDPVFVAISDQRGQPGRVIASIVNGVPFWGITLRKDIEPIKYPQELKGLSVATFPAPSTAYVLQADMFRRGGLEPNIRQGAFGALLAIMKSGQADIALELEPNVSTSVAKDQARILYSLAAIYGDFAITGLTATPDYLRAHPDTAAKTVCAIRRSIAFIRSRPSETLELLAKRFPEIDRTVATAALSRVAAEGVIPAGAAIAASAWKKAADLRASVGDVQNLKSFDAYVDNSFADRADRECKEP